MEVPTLKGLELKGKVPDTVAKIVKDAPKIIQCKSKKSTPNGGGYGTGKRKDAVARVWVKPGKGMITVNKKDISKYFARESYRTSILRVFADTNTSGQFDVICTTKGGGTTGQAGAIIHGIARALDCISEDYHDILRKNGFLTRDSRTVERKKYGRRKARKKAQFSKR
jgi:small subunit ribosomal protein S9